MNLANPGALLWGLLLVPIVIFYILKIRMRRVPVSTVLFWRQIFDEKKPRSLWQKLRHLISLLFQLALLLLVVFALTKPFFSWESMHARRVVLVIDNSASMNSTEVTPSRLAKAKEEAQRVISSLRFHDEMAIVVAGSQPRVVCGLTDHQKTLRQIVEEIAATDEPSQLAGAVALARRLAADTQGSLNQNRIVVISDGCDESSVELAKASDVAFIVVGRATGNVAITRFQTRRGTIDPLSYEILAEVTNLSDQPVEDLWLNISLEGSDIEVKPLKLGPNGRWSEVVENRTAAGGLLTAKLVVKEDRKYQPYVDSLLADNQAVAVLPRREPLPTHMHSPGGSLFLQKVLEAYPLVQLTTSKQLPEQFSSGTVTVLHRETPAKLPPGLILVVDPSNSCDLWNVGEKLQSPIVTQQDKDSPLMAHVRLDNVIMPEARKLTFLPAAGKPDILARAVSGDPLFAVVNRPEGKVVVLTVNLDLGDLPFRTAFPIMAMNTLSFFSDGHGELREALATGATAEVSLPAGGAFLLRGPDGSTRKLPVGVEKAMVGPFEYCGLWTVVPESTNPTPVEQLAVNLMNKTESNLRPPDNLVASTSAAEAGLAGSFLGGPAWWYLTFLAWGLAAIEWFLYQRRWIS